MITFWIVSHQSKLTNQTHYSRSGCGLFCITLVFEIYFLFNNKITKIDIYKKATT